MAALEALLNPQRVAVVGATPRENAAGRRIIEHAGGPRFRGTVFAINPGYDEVLGRPCLPTLADVPDTPHCAVMAVSDSRIAAAMEDAASAGVKGAVLLGRLVTAEDGGRTLPDRIAAIAREAGMAVCGANCMGLFNTRADVRLSLSDLPGLDQPGRIGLVSHSGSTWSGLGGNKRSLHFSTGVSAGNELVTGIADYLDHLVTHEATSAVAMILETVRDGERFLAAIEAADSAGIPLVALKLARSATSRAFAFTHSGALAGDERVLDAVFRRHNVIAVDTLDEMMDTLEAVACERVPPVDTVAVQTDSGGERQLITDLAERENVPLATFSNATRQALARVLDPGLDTANPVDYWGESGFEALPQVTSILGNADEAGVVVFATNMVSGRELLYRSSEALEATHRASTKPCMMMGNITSTIDDDEARRLRTAGIPVLCGTLTGLRAIRHLITWHANRRTRHNPVPPLPQDTLAHWRHQLSSGQPQPEDLLALLASLGLDVPRTRTCGLEDDLGPALEFTGCPAVLKTANRDIAHKTEAGGVMTGLTSDTAVRQAWRTMSSSLGPKVLVQETAPDGVEMIVGMITDPVFGPVMTIGAGGILVEVLDDAVMFVPPVSTEEADALIGRLKVSAVLDGVRGRPPLDRLAAADAVSRLSRLAASLGDFLEEFDINPLIVHSRGAMAVDVLVRCKQ
ncbi:MAG: acetate--CoA ligase family protein [bacterium]|nr:acetate--CoA ligase family protein [bacterium]